MARVSGLWNAKLQQVFLVLVLQVRSTRKALGITLVGHLARAQGQPQTAEDRLLQNRQVHFHTGQVHVLLLTHGDVVHHLAGTETH